jgi:hypothetical protein
MTHFGALCVVEKKVIAASVPKESFVRCPDLAEEALHLIWRAEDVVGCG